MLTGEVTIASNKIYLAFDETKWRPTYYSVVDNYVKGNILDNINTVEVPSFFPAYFRNSLPPRKNFYFVPILNHGEWNGTKYASFEPKFSDDIATGIYAGESVTYFNIQVLAYMGCDPIYLLGVDFSFKATDPKLVDSGYGYIYEGGGEVNHFHKDYRPPGEKWTMPNLKEQELCFDYAAKLFASRHKSLYNASRQTKLTVIPGVTLEEALKSNHAL